MARQFLLTFVLGAALVIALASHSYSDELVIDDDVTGTQVINGAPFDSILINEDGTITTTATFENGVNSLVTGTTITNNGGISTQGAAADGIFNTGDAVTITNNGGISTQGIAADGIVNTGDAVTITNNLTIKTSGVGSNGIEIAGDSATVTNDGTIINSGANSGSTSDTGGGIDIIGNDATITNNGTIATIAEGGHALSVTGSGATIANTSFDTISVSGDQADGINISGDNASVTNSGKVTAYGVDSNGIEIAGDSATITNSGMVENTGSRTGDEDAAGHGIAVLGDDATVMLTGTGAVSSENGSAIYIDGANATVTLQDEAFAFGELTFIDATTASFAYEGSRTAIFGFSGVPGSLSSDGLVFGTYGNTVTFVNTDEFQLATTSLTFNALSREVADVVEKQMNAEDLPGSAFIATNGTPDQTISNGWSVWASPFGGFLNRDGKDGFDHSFGGLMSGAERSFGADYRAGVTGGFSVGRTDSNSTIHLADTYSVFAGTYAARSWQETFAQFSLLGGYLNSAEEVTVLNNMVAGGLQDLSIDYDYLFLTPTARVGHAFALTHGTLTPSLRARYSGLWQTGSANEAITDLSISGRSLNVLELRGQTTFDFTPVISDAGALQFGLTAGVDGVFTLSDNVDGDIAGTGLNLSIDNDDAVVRGFGRADAVWKSNGNAAFLASVEGGYDSAKTLSASVRVGGKIRF